MLTPEQATALRSDLAADGVFVGDGTLGQGMLRLERLAMSSGPDEPAAVAGTGPVKDDERPGRGEGPRLRLASAVMFVGELERSVRFYRELLALEITVHDDTAALLVSPDGFQLYLRSMGLRAHHPLGSVGVQYLIWTADGEDDLRRCEQVLRAWSSNVTRQTAEGFTVVEGRGPDDVPVLVTYPGPDEVPRQGILRRFYQW